MTNHEAIQWLIDNRAEYLLMNIKGIFCLKVFVKDPHGEEDHYTVFRLEETFIQNYFAPTVAALKESING